MSLFKISFGYFSNISTILYSLITIPFLITTLGIDQYGVIAIFGFIQGVFTFFEFGTPTVLLQKYSNKKLFSQFKARLSHYTNSIFNFYLLVFVFFLLFVPLIYHFASPHLFMYIASESREIFIPSIIMVLICCLKLISNILKSILQAVGDINWLSANSILNSTLKFFLTLVGLTYLSKSLILFFIIQLICTIIEIFHFKSRLSNTKVYDFKFQKIQFKHLLRDKSLFLSLSILALLSISLRYFDKFLLSKFLSFEDLGYYSLAVSLTGFLLIFATTLSDYYFPLLNNHRFSDDARSLANTYLELTQVSSVVFSVVSAVIFYFNQELLYIWTGNESFKSSSILIKILTIGNLFNGLSIISYLLLLAFSYNKIIIYNNILVLVFSIPLQTYLIPLYGATAAAFLWLVTNFLYVSITTFFIHKFLFKNIPNLMFYKYLYSPIVFSFTISFFFKILFENFNYFHTRFLMLFFLMIYSLALFIVIGLFFPKVRSLIINKINFHS